MKLFYLITTLCWTTVCLAARQQLVFHSEFDCTGDGLLFQSKIANFSAEGCGVFSTHKSIALIGTWGIGYDEDFWATGFYGGTENSWCYTDSRPIVRSLRYLGPPDTTTPSISLYQGGSYQGQEITITGPAFANIPFVPQSIYGTQNTTWTFYTGNNFDGNATCFVPPWQANGWYYYLSSLNSTWSNVGSISRGCDGRIDEYVLPKGSSDN